MIALVSLLAVISAVSATGLHAPVVAGVAVPVHGPRAVAVNDGYHYTSTGVEDEHGSLKQQTAVGKDGLGGHSIHHSAQATRHNPLSGETAVKHDDHAFHINPFYGQAAVHTNNAEGAVNPAFGSAAYRQKTHDAKIAHGHTSVVDTADTAAVSPHGTAASHDIAAASADVVHDGLHGGVANTAHVGHRSYAQGPHIGGVNKASSTTEKRFDGHGYGNLHYNSRAASHAYDPYGHASSDEVGYDLSQAYDARVGLGASNELEYSRHAAKDPYGNYGAVSRAKESSHGGHLVPAYAAVYKQPVVYKKSVVHKEPVVYGAAYAPVQSVAYGPAAYVPTHTNTYVQPGYHYY